MMWCWHSWTKWKLLDDLPLFTSDADGKNKRIIGQMLVQERECIECGKVKRRVERVTVFS